jgi:hypothetical protein
MNVNVINSWEELSSYIETVAIEKWNNNSNSKKKCTYSIGRYYDGKIDMTYKHLGIRERELYADVMHIHSFERVLLDICRKYTDSTTKFSYNRKHINYNNDKMYRYEYIISMECRKAYERKLCTDCVYGQLVLNKHVMVQRPTRTTGGIMDVYYNCNICNFEEIQQNV